MKKSLSIFALAVAIILSISAHTGRVVDAAPGQIAPDFSVTTPATDGKDLTKNLSDIKGYRLVTFWSVTDAQSRVANALYDSAVKALGSDADITVIGVNFDDNRPLFNEIVKHDSLDADSQYNVEGSEAQDIIDLYHLRDGYRTLLVDPKGVIIAVDPEPANLGALITAA